MSEEEDDELEIIFEPDEALILALNEIDNLKQLIEDQNSSIEELRKELIAFKKLK
jgi:hypothetical protein